MEGPKAVFILLLAIACCSVNAEECYECIYEEVTGTVEDSNGLRDCLDSPSSTGLKCSTTNTDASCGKVYIEYDVKGEYLGQNVDVKIKQVQRYCPQNNSPVNCQETTLSGSIPYKNEKLSPRLKEVLGPLANMTVFSSGDYSYLAYDCYCQGALCNSSVKMSVSMAVLVITFLLKYIL